MLLCDAERYRRASPFLQKLSCAAIICRCFTPPHVPEAPFHRVDLFSDVIGRWGQQPPGTSRPTLLTALRRGRGKLLPPFNVDTDEPAAIMYTRYLQKSDVKRLIAAAVAPPVTPKVLCKPTEASRSR